MNNPANRREFLKTTALAGAAITLPKPLAFPPSSKIAARLHQILWL